MHLDPHTLHALVEKVHSQLRCPQCMKKVAVELQSLKVIGDSFAVFQLHCRTCEAHIFLHATLRTVHAMPGERRPDDVARGGRALACEGGETQSTKKNFSTTLELEERELLVLRQALKETGGNFSEVFEESL